MEAFIVLVLFGIIIWYFMSKRSDQTTSSLTDELPAMMAEFDDNMKLANRENNKIRMSTIPIQNRGTILNKGEVAIFDAPIIMARSVKTGAKWKSGNRGVRISPIRGLSFNVGGSKGQMVNSREFQQDIGWLTLTTKRIIFKGKSINFASSIGKIENVTRDDALCFVDLTNRDVPDFHAAFANSSVATLFTLLYTDPDREIELQLTE